MLKQRIVTAVLLVAAFAIALFRAPPVLWAGVNGVVLAIAAWEWAGFARASQAARIAYAAAMTLVGGAVAIVTGLAAGSTGTLELLGPIYSVALMFWLLAVPLWLKVRPARPHRGLVLLAGWMVLLPAYIALVQLRNIHPLTLLAFMLVVWIADIAAYFTGRRFGRRKLSPQISPGKTWEGLYGALAANAVYALLWATLARQHTPTIVRDLPATWLWMVALVMVLTGLSVVGDLFESSLKRRAGLKDSSAILPGHGGVLDRIDALTPVLPAAALVSMIL